MSFDKNLQSTARRLADSMPRNTDAVPAELRERILNALPETRNKFWGRRLLTPALLAGGVAVFFAIPHLLASHSKPQSSGALPPTVRVQLPPKPGDPLIAAVRDAVSRVSTVHLIGEETQWGVGEPKEHREVWWQRKPFFYREQFGNETFIDDGTNQTYMVGSASTLLPGIHLPGIAITTPSTHHELFDTYALDELNSLLTPPDAQGYKINFGGTTRTMTHTHMRSRPDIIRDVPYLAVLDELNKVNASARIYFERNTQGYKGSVSLEPQKLDDLDIVLLRSKLMRLPFDQFATTTVDTVQNSSNKVMLQRRRTVRNGIGMYNKHFEQANDVDTVRIAVDCSTKLLRSYESVIENNPVASATPKHVVSAKPKPLPWPSHSVMAGVRGLSGIEATDTWHEIKWPENNWRKTGQYRAIFRAEYNKPLPEGVKTFSAPEGVLRAGTGDLVSLPLCKVISAEQDVQGNVHLRVQPDGILSNVLKAPQCARIYATSFIATDEAGHIYVQIKMPSKTHDTDDVYLTPLEPDFGKTSPIKHLDIKFFADIDAYSQYIVPASTKSALLSSVASASSIQQKDETIIIGDQHGVSNAAFQELCAAARARYYDFLGIGDVPAAYVSFQNQPEPSETSSGPNLSTVLAVHLSNDIITLTAHAGPSETAKKKNLQTRAAHWFTVAAQDALERGAKGVARDYSFRAKKLLLGGTQLLNGQAAPGS